MSKKRTQSLASSEIVEQSILSIRGHKVLLDADLAQLYGVEIRILLRAMKRNITRFPDDFSFQLTRDEWTALRSQIGTLDVAGQPSEPASAEKRRRGQHRKYLPYAFTEQGVAMLSSVLRSQRAVNVNIEIMRAFVRLRKVLAVNAELARRLDELESRVGSHDEQFMQVIKAIRQRRRIGFHSPDGTEPKRQKDNCRSDARDRIRQVESRRYDRSLEERGIHD